MGSYKVLHRLCIECSIEQRWAILWIQTLFIAKPSHIANLTHEWWYLAIDLVQPMRSTPAHYKVGISTPWQLSTNISGFTPHAAPQTLLWTRRYKCNQYNLFLFSFFFFSLALALTQPTFGRETKSITRWYKTFFQNRKIWSSRGSSFQRICDRTKLRWQKALG